jgi:predicted HAD superfamily Cof-like phosphohydrolase
MNFVNQIHEFNSQAGLLDKPYSDYLESSFQIEEALEGFTDLPQLASLLGVQEATPKYLSRAIIATANNGSDLTDVERLDKACDAIVFAFGSIFKLGLNPEQAARAVSIVMSANLAKLSMPKDEFGKLTKPTNFVGPEAQLQELLNERSPR